MYKHLTYTHIKYLSDTARGETWLAWGVSHNACHLLYTLWLPALHVYTERGPGFVIIVVADIIVSRRRHWNVCRDQAKHRGIKATGHFSNQVLMMTNDHLTKRMQWKRSEFNLCNKFCRTLSSMIGQLVYFTDINDPPVRQHCFVGQLSKIWTCSLTFPIFYQFMKPCVFRECNCQENYQCPHRGSMII